MNACKNCWFYCHADGNCYATEARMSGVVPASKPVADGCIDWKSDGLEEWERNDEK